MNALNSVAVDDSAESLFPNVYYSPELEDIFIYILSRIPLWSNLMVDVFGSTSYAASSGGSESSFKGFKYDYGTKIFDHFMLMYFSKHTHSSFLYILSNRFE